MNARSLAIALPVFAATLHAEETWTIEHLTNKEGRKLTAQVEYIDKEFVKLRVNGAAVDIRRNTLSPESQNRITEIVKERAQRVADEIAALEKAKEVKRAVQRTAKRGESLEYSGLWIGMGRGDILDLVRESEMKWVTSVGEWGGSGEIDFLRGAVPAIATDGNGTSFQCRSIAVSFEGDALYEIGIRSDRIEPSRFLLELEPWIKAAQKAMIEKFGDPVAVHEKTTPEAGFATVLAEWAPKEKYRASLRLGRTTDHWLFAEIYYYDKPVVDSIKARAKKIKGGL